MGYIRDRNYTIMRFSYVFRTGFLSLEVETGSFVSDYVIFCLVRPFVP